jgi:hypothetical protein
MQKHFFTLLGATFLLAIAAPLFAAPETITGEVISLSCYTQDKTEIGRKGFTCALATIKWEGNPAGILTADGKVYQVAGGLAANNNEKLWALIGHTVTVTGDVTQRPGLLPLIAAADAKDLSPPK